MVKILFMSIVRDGQEYLPRYFEQLNSLRYEYEISLAINEGDSVDNSRELILSQSNTLPIYLYNYSHKGQKFGSIDNPTRWMNIAKTWNYMLNLLTEEEIFDKYDYVIYMEADLIWNKSTIDKLIDGLEKSFGEVIAPMSMLGNIFYDTWGHRSDGINFGPVYPFHANFEKYSRYVPLTSAGSCLAMKPVVAKQCRLSEVDAMMGHDIKKYSFSFVLDKTAKVNHP